MRSLYAALGAIAVAGALSGVLTVDPAQAEDTWYADEGSTLVLGVGYTDPIQDGADAADFRLDYRHGEGLWFLKPFAGIQATSEGSVWGGAGVYIDIPIYGRIFLTGSAAVGGYSQGGGKDLGSVLEFRTQGEVTYRFDNGMRLGGAVSHISNASTADDNPGINFVSAIFVVPLGAVIPD